VCFAVKVKLCKMLNKSSCTLLTPWLKYFYEACFLDTFLLEFLRYFLVAKRKRFWHIENFVENLPFGFKDWPQSSLNPALPFTLHYNVHTFAHRISRERAKTHTVARRMKNLRRWKQPTVLSGMKLYVVYPVLIT